MRHLQVIGTDNLLFEQFVFGVEGQLCRFHLGLGSFYIGFGYIDFSYDLNGIYREKEVACFHIVAFIDVLFENVTADPRTYFHTAIGQQNAGVRLGEDAFFRFQL